METSEREVIESRAGIHPIVHLMSPEKPSWQSLVLALIDVWLPSREGDSFNRTHDVHQRKVKLTPLPPRRSILASRTKRDLATWWRLNGAGCFRRTRLGWDRQGPI
jgi:hypothetical protein